MSDLLRERVRWDLGDGVARITLARPDAGNALDVAMAEGIREAAERVERGAADGSVRVALLAAEGKLFCVGGDLREFAGAEPRNVPVATVANELHRAILIFRRTPVPIVSVVHSTVAGGGIGVALAADIVLIVNDAKIRLAYTAAGLSPDCGATWMLSHRLGPARALDLTLTNRVLTGADAAEWGLVSRAVPADRLSTVAEQLVEEFRIGPTAAFAATKALVEAAPSRTLAEQLDAEASSIGGLVNGPDARERVDAFLARRAPVLG